MAILLAVFVPAVVVGATAALLTRRWPAADLAAPHLAPETVVEQVTERPRLMSWLRSRRDPAVETGLALTVAVSAVIAAGVIAGLLFVMVRLETGLERYDLSAARFGAQRATDLSTDLLRVITLPGGTAGMAVIAMVVAAVEYRRQRAQAVIGFLLLVVLGQTTITNLIKILVDRTRPDLDRLTGFSGASFPSGHAAAAAAVLAATALLLGRGRSVRVKAVLAGLATGAAVAVAATRVLLGVHWLTDVLAGLAIGWGWFALCSIAFGGRILRFGAPAETAEAAAGVVVERRSM